RFWLLLPPRPPPRLGCHRDRPRSPPDCGFNPVHQGPNPAGPAPALAWFNAGLCLPALHALGVRFPLTLGVRPAVVGGLWPLAKAWLYVPLARSPLTARRSEQLWQGDVDAAHPGNP